MIADNIDMLIIESLFKAQREKQENERPFMQLEIPVEDLDVKETKKEHVEARRVIVIEL